jgi:hypothetical protein
MLFETRTDAKDSQQQGNEPEGEGLGGGGIGEPGTT